MERNRLFQDLRLEISNQNAVFLSRGLPGRTSQLFLPHLVLRFLRSEPPKPRFRKRPGPKERPRRKRRHLQKTSFSCRFLVGGLGFGGPKTPKNGKKSHFFETSAWKFPIKMPFFCLGGFPAGPPNFFPPPSFAIFALRGAKPERSKTSSLLAFSLSFCQFPLCLLFPVWCSFLPR